MLVNLLPVDLEARTPDERAGKGLIRDRLGLLGEDFVDEGSVGQTEGFKAR